MRILKFLVLASLSLSACAELPHGDIVAASNTQSASVVEPHAVKVESAASSVPAIAPQPKVALPKMLLTNSILYEYLVSEIADQRGYRTLAATGSEDLAVKTKDPRLAKRAAQLAFESGDMDKAIEAFKFWQEVDPTATVPPRMLGTIWLRGGQLDKAKTELATVLSNDKTNIGDTFLQITQMLMGYPDKAAALNLMQGLAAPYPNVAEAHWSVSQLAMNAGDPTQALEEIHQALKLKPDWSMAISLEAEILQVTSPKEGLQLLKDYLAKTPDDYQLRLQYARALVAQQQYPAARDEFRRVQQHDPDNPDLAFATALLSLQMNDLKGAEDELKESLSKGKKDQDTVQFYLGQLSEAKKQNDEAIEHYRQVSGGEHQFAAKMRLAYLLSQQGKLDEALDILHKQQVDDPQQHMQVILVEAQLLRDAKRYDDSFQVLQQGLQALPTDSILIYETAMMADKIGKYELSEQYLRKLMQMNPNDANAYNALGYSLLERNVRISEALSLVEKALQLSPNDPAIMDSVGWGYYLSGKLDDSVKMLRRAFAGNADPEIASHLGTALWADGDKDEAKKVLHDSLKDHPDNEELRAVIKKLEL